jgi:hypothetical protein
MPASMSQKILSTRIHKYSFQPFEELRTRRRRSSIEKPFECIKHKSFHSSPFARKPPIRANPPALFTLSARVKWEMAWFLVIAVTCSDLQLHFESKMKFFCLVLSPPDTFSNLISPRRAAKSVKALLRLALLFPPLRHHPRFMSMLSLARYCPGSILLLHEAEG